MACLRSGVVLACRGKSTATAANGFAECRVREHVKEARRSPLTRRSACKPPRTPLPLSSTLPAFPCSCHGFLSCLCCFMHVFYFLSFKNMCCNSAFTVCALFHCIWSEMNKNQSIFKSCVQIMWRHPTNTDEPIYIFNHKERYSVCFKFYLTEIHCHFFFAGVWSHGRL